MARVLSLASSVLDPTEEFFNIHMREYGARICQDLLAGLCIAPEFGYTPWEEIEIPEPASAMTTLDKVDKGKKGSSRIISRKSSKRSGNSAGNTKSKSANRKQMLLDQSIDNKVGDLEGDLNE